MFIRQEEKNHKVNWTRFSQIYYGARGTDGSEDKNIYYIQVAYRISYKKFKGYKSNLAKSKQIDILKKEIPGVKYEELFAYLMIKHKLKNCKHNVTILSDMIRGIDKYRDN